MATSFGDTARARPHRPIPVAVHALMELPLAALAIAGPWLFGFSDDDTARVASIVAGAIIALVAMTTRWRLSLVKLVPLRGHAYLDIGLGLALVLAPFVRLRGRDRGADPPPRPRPRPAHERPDDELAHRGPDRAGLRPAAARRPPDATAPETTTARRSRGRAGRCASGGGAAGPVGRRATSGP
jgi:hypothetical protein